MKVDLKNLRAVVSEQIERTINHDRIPPRKSYRLAFYMEGGGEQCILDTTMTGRAIASKLRDLAERLERRDATVKR